MIFFRAADVQQRDFPRSTRRKIVAAFLITLSILPCRLISLRKLPTILLPHTTSVIPSMLLNLCSPPKSSAELCLTRNLKG
jgi:hypothetical protein